MKRKFWILRSVFKRADNSESLKELSEEGFLFLTERSEFWRSQRPIYATTRGKRRKEEL